MKHLTTRNFLFALAVLAIVDGLLECVHLSDKDRVMMFILTVAEICFLDYFMKKADGQSEEGEVVI